MKHLLSLIAIAAALTACSKNPETPAAPAAAPAPAAAAPAAQPAPAPVPAPAPAVAGGDLPKECNDYADKVTACVSKQGGPSADAIKASLDQTKASWAGMGADKAALGAACKAATDAFAAQASAMKC